MYKSVVILNNQHFIIKAVPFILFKARSRLVKHVAVL